MVSGRRNGALLRAVVWRRSILWRSAIVRWRSILGRRIRLIRFLGRWRRILFLIFVFVVLLGENERGHHQKQKKDGPLGKDFFDLEIEIHYCLLNFLAVTQYTPRQVLYRNYASGKYGTPRLPPINNIYITERLACAVD